MNINKTIHEAMGLCWHEATMELGKLICQKCSVHVEYVPANPDYTTDPYNGMLMNWMRLGARPLHLDNYLGRNKRKGMYSFFKMDRQEQITLIAEAIEAGVLKEREGK